MNDKGQGSFKKAIQGRSKPGVASDVWHYLRANNKWWLLPIIVICLTMGLVMLLSGTAVAPFIYTIF
jgi:hypothetical protein